MNWSLIIQILTETDWFKIIEIAANIAIIFTFFVYWRQLLAMQGQLKAMQEANQNQTVLMQSQLKAMQEANQNQIVLMQSQLKAMQDASQSQNILTVTKYIQQQDIRDARKTLISLRHKPFREWMIEERKGAEIACASYDLVGILARQGIVPLKIIVDNWGDSIKKCYIAAEPMLTEYKKPEERGPNFWDDFDWLYREVEKSPLWKQKNDEPVNSKLNYKPAPD